MQPPASGLLCGRMRRVLETIVRWLAEALVRLYYPHRSVEGAERLPREGPVVFVANHPNGLLDPLLVRVMTGRPARFLAKSTLFGNPAGRLAMDAFGSIPVYRAKEAAGKDASRNEESFARCRAALARRRGAGAVPGGVSHSDPQMRPLKTGAARIALSAGEDAPGLRVLPVGLFYERKVLFRSRVLLVVGEPLPVAPLLPALPQRRARGRRRADRRHPRAARRGGAAGRVARPSDRRRARRQLDRRDGDAGAEEDDLAARHRRTRELLAAYGRVHARDPARVEAIASAARGYARTLQHLGVTDPWALEVEMVSARAGGRDAAQADPSARRSRSSGAILGYIPYRLAGQVAQRVTRGRGRARHGEDDRGRAVLVARLERRGDRRRRALGRDLGRAGLPARRRQRLRRRCASASWRARPPRRSATWRCALFHRDTARRLADRRRALADAVASALREAA